MKRILLSIGAVAILLVVLVGGAIASAFMGRAAVVNGADINGAHIIEDGIVSVAMLPVGDGKVMLVDAGNDVEATAILAELARRGLGREAVAAIALTHGHADHIGGVRQFPRAEVLALRGEVPLVEGREGAKGPLLRLMPVSPTGIKVSRPLTDGERIMVGDTLVQVFALPGHTAGSAAYLIGGVLFVGDSADTGSDGLLRGAPWIFSDSQADNRAALVRLNERLQREAVTVDAIVPSHSAGSTDGLSALDAYARAQRGD